MTPPVTAEMIEELKGLIEKVRQEERNVLCYGGPTGAHSSDRDALHIAAFILAPALLARIAELEAHIAAEPERMRAVVEALQGVIDQSVRSYKARNGRYVSIECEDGEAAEIVHSDAMTAAREALAAIRATQEPLPMLGYADATEESGK